MTKKRFRTQGHWALILVLVLILSIGLTVGRYYTTVSVPGTVTFSASLATSIVVQERIPQRQPNGEYTLSNNYTQKGAEYTLIPGLDVPKDPHVVITGKTPVEAYLYLVVEDKLADAVTYTLDACWKPVPEKPNVYVYSDANGDPVVIDNNTQGLDEINILENKKIYVSQKLVKDTASGTLTFSAVLKEIGNNGWTAAEVFG